MKKRLGFILYFLLIILLFTSYSYGSNVDGEVLIKEKYDLLKEENQRQRKEILKLYNRLSPKRASKVPVLLYHHLLKEEEIKAKGWQKNGSVISVEAFEDQMKYLHDNGYFVATLDELLSFLNGNIELPSKTVLITFDDGYLSNTHYAYPIMKKYGFKATIFTIGSVSLHESIAFNPNLLQFISKDVMYKYEYVFDYECHTFNMHKSGADGHPLLLTSNKDEIVEDLLKNKGLFNTKYIAYPHGKFTNDTIEYLKELGYEMGFTVKSGYVEKDMNRFQLPRFIIGPGTTIDKFKKILGD